MTWKMPAGMDQKYLMQIKKAAGQEAPQKGEERNDQGTCFSQQ